MSSDNFGQVQSEPTSRNLNETQNDDGSETSEPITRNQMLKKSIAEFCAESTIHGIKYFVGSNRHWIEKLWWVIAFFAAFAWCLLYIHSIWVNWITQPVAFELQGQTGMTIDKIPFPAVTICTTNKFDIDKINMDSLMAMSRIIEANKSALMSFSPDMINKLDALQNICLREMGDWPEDLVVPRTESIYTTFDKMQLDMRSVIPASEFLNQPTALKPLLTGHGLCYIFNAINSREIYTDEIAPELLTVNDNPEATWNIENGYEQTRQKDVAYPYRVFDSSARNNLFVKLAIGVDEPYQHCNVHPPGLRLALHSPHQLPRMTHNFIYISANQNTFISVKPSVFHASQKLRDFSPTVRGCYFRFERKLRFFKVYSQSNCIRECLANHTKDKCGCVAFPNPRFNKTKVCTMAKKKCYRKVSVEIMRNPISNECLCLPGCNEISYDTQISQSPKVMRFINGRENYTNILVISFKESNFISFLRKETNSVAHFIADCGGILSLFLGISALSIIEMIYYFTLRLVCNIRQWNSIRPIAPQSNRNQVFVIHH